MQASKYNILVNQKANNKVLIAQIAPSVRIGLQTPANKIVTGLKRIGFDYVFDTLFAADLTIVEEGNELIKRIKTGRLNMPMFTSCCPGWMKLVKSSYPSLLEFVSTTRSPQEMMGSLVKRYYADHHLSGHSASDIYLVSFMPCTRKGEEALIYGNNDLVITTNELSSILLERSIDLQNLEETEFDKPFSFGSGGAILFGRSGGVMTSALRFVYETLSGNTMPNVEFKQNNLIPTIKEARVDIPCRDGLVLTINVAIICGLGDAKKYIAALEEGKVHHHFVEVMSCVPSGCITGGGQAVKNDPSVYEKRLIAINELDNEASLKAAHENQDIKSIYDDYLGHPMSEIAHELLHRHE